MCILFKFILKFCYWNLVIERSTEEFLNTLRSCNRTADLAAKVSTRAAKKYNKSWIRGDDPGNPERADS